MTATPSQFLSQRSVTVPCRECGVTIEHPFPSLAKYGAICDGCADKDNERISREMRARSQIIDVSGWERICPAEFQNTEPHKLPSPTKLQAVLKWQFGAKGLVLHGPTGAGKSRCLYVLLKREFAAGRTIRVLTHDSAYRYAERFGESPAAVLAWVDDKTKCDLLALDDVFKAKLTDSFEQALFTITSQRTERGRPIVLTTNDVGDSIVARMSPDRGAAFVRRLREFCTPISFASANVSEQTV